jgi:hypothetical protein
MAVPMKGVVLWVINPNSYLTGDTLRLHYRSQSVKTMIWGFHDGDYEEYRILGYKNPVLTSQEILYVSATDPSLLKLCPIWDF